jgi:hypothetical protein
MSNRLVQLSGSCSSPDRSVPEMHQEKKRGIRTNGQLCMQLRLMTLAKHSRHLQY